MKPTYLEAVRKEFDELLSKHCLSDDRGTTLSFEEVANWLKQKLDEAYTQGYNDAKKPIKVTEAYQKALEDALEAVGEDEDITLKDLNKRDHNMMLNSVHRQGRNELREEIRDKIKALMNGGKE